MLYRRKLIVWLTFNALRTVPNKYKSFCARLGLRQLQVHVYSWISV